ncbi:MAG: RNA-binding transcriptional accessory protein [Firmicutes bacterium]|nr:RNA-binding transcriptional accessory protein [Bacillota bacterium]
MYNEIAALQQEFNLKKTQVENTVKLIDEGNTIPFIARYRKEMTGSLDDQVLRELYDRLMYLRSLNEKCEQTKKLIDEQGQLTDEIAAALDNAKTLSEIEDIYRPFRPKRRTRATVAKEKGLQPLADFIMLQLTDDDILKEAEKYIDPEKQVETAQQALEGASDIIAESISDNADYRKIIRKLTFDKGVLEVKAADPEAQSVYEMYYDFHEPVKKIAGHRVLAVNRGEKEGVLSVRLEAPVEDIYNKLKKELIFSKRADVIDFLTNALDDSYKRLIAPSIEREIRNDLTEKAEESAIKVFGENLRQLLLQAPIKEKVVLALDPGFRTGCKVAVIDGFGKVLDTGVIYPVPPHNKVDAANKILTAMINKHGVNIIAIGNGTASRETEQFAVDLIKKLNKEIYYIIVNEAGASVYSASKLGAEEFPDYDVALRSAVSIGRRLQDPLAELVKIDPKSIGVGQYQHDMNQKLLGEALGGVVEGCVNSVGIDLNTASPSLLGYVAGISGTVAKNIIAYRQENGPFTNRKQLLKVAKLGPKAYEQCAGFLRIDGGTEPFDNTGVHPESYAVAEELLTKLGYTKNDLSVKGLDLSKKIGDIKKLAQEMNVGVPTLTDIVKELEKPGRDPRDEMPKPVLRSDVLGIEDLSEGMIMRGTVRNVIDFGAFVDIGVHQDGLVHISQMSRKYIKHPLEAVSVGDIVEVKVLSVDVKKQRISLSMLIDK